MHALQVIKTVSAEAMEDEYPDAEGLLRAVAAWSTVLETARRAVDFAPALEPDSRTLLPPVIANNFHQIPSLICVRNGDRRLRDGNQPVVLGLADGDPGQRIVSDGSGSGASRSWGAACS